MLIIRKFGSLLRGKATPFQIYSACLIGSIVGFLPAKMQCLGLYLIFFAIVLVLNSNLFITAFLIPTLKLASYILVVPSIQIGRAILDSSAGGFFKTLINAPFIAWSGLEYYVTLGSLLFGLLFGVIIGSTMVALITKFRKTMVVLENDSEKYKKWSEKKYVKILVWLFLGKGKGNKITYEELLEKKVGNPIRILGVIIVVLGIGLAYFLNTYWTNEVITYQLTQALGTVNGATVDIANVDAKLTQGKIKIEKLEFADPKDLKKNRFVFEELELDIDINALLRKKITVEHLNIGKIASNTIRSYEGQLIVSPPAPPEDPSKPGLFSNLSDKALEQIPLKDSYEDFDDLLETFNDIKAKYNEILNHEITKKIIAMANAPKVEKEVTFQDAIKEAYNNCMDKRLKADQLIEKSPFLRINEIKCDKAFYSSEKFRDATLKIKDISSEPALLETPPSIEIVNAPKKYETTIQFKHYQKPELANEMVLQIKDIDAEALGKKIIIQGKKPLKNGLLQISCTSQFVNLDDFMLKGKADLQKAEIEVPEFDTISIKSLPIVFELHPFVMPPKFSVDSDNLKKVLLKEAKNQLKNKAKDALNNVKDDILGEHKLDANLLQNKDAQNDIMNNIKNEPDKLKDVKNIFKKRDDKKEDKKDDKKKDETKKENSK